MLRKIVEQVMVEGYNEDIIKKEVSKSVKSALKKDGYKLLFSITKVISYDEEYEATVWVKIKKSEVPESEIADLLSKYFNQEIKNVSDEDLQDFHINIIL